MCHDFITQLLKCVPFQLEFSRRVTFSLWFRIGTSSRAGSTNWFIRSIAAIVVICQFQNVQRISSEYLSKHFYFIAFFRSTLFVMYTCNISSIAVISNHIFRIIRNFKSDLQNNISLKGKYYFCHTIVERHQGDTFPHQKVSWLDFITDLNS